MKSPLFLTLPAERKKSELGESLPDVTERSSHLRVYSIRYVELDHKGVKTSLKPSLHSSPWQQGKAAVDSRAGCA